MQFYQRNKSEDKGLQLMVIVFKRERKYCTTKKQIFYPTLDYLGTQNLVN